MLISAELRWFWEGDCPDDVSQWFHRARPEPGGGETRQDVYLLASDDPRQDQSAASDRVRIGIKKRGEKPGVEIKGLVSIVKGSGTKPFGDDVQLWCKWTFIGDLNFQKVITTHKTRWLRKFDTGGKSVTEIPLGPDEKPLNGAKLPDQGCNLELTRVTVDRSRREWWTLGFEAFGQIDSAQKNLAQATAFATSASSPSTTSGMFKSYPEWLDLIVGKAKKS
jgi:hypothetical protein